MRQSLEDGFNEQRFDTPSSRASMSSITFDSPISKPLDRKVWTERFVQYLLKKKVKVDARLLRLVADDMWKFGRHAEPHVLAQSLVDAR
jgi:hypothetical protein